MWEFCARMALARKDLLEHVEIKSEQAVQRGNPRWKAEDMKALAVLVKMLSPTYQSMVRECKTANEAWETLKNFFCKKNLHNRVQLRKELHDAAGDNVNEDEKMAILLGSLPSEYDAMVRIIETQSETTLLDAKEMLRREFETLQKREQKETAFKAAAQRGGSNGGSHGRGRGRGRGRGGRWSGGRGSNFPGKCFGCGQSGHKQADCPTKKTRVEDDEFVFSATCEKSAIYKTWLLDSGASCHVTSERGDFDDFRELASPIVITLTSGERLDARGSESVRFTLQNGAAVTLTDVLYVPMLDRRLVSVAALTAHGVLVQFEHGKATLVLNGSVVAVIQKEGKLFAWNVQPEGHDEAHEAVVQRVRGRDSALWHARLGHVSDSKLKLIRAACDGVPEFPRQDDGVCGGCACGKMSTSPFAHRSGSEVKTSHPFQIVHSDVMGPIKPVSKGGARYMLTFIDDFTRFVHIYPIPNKAVVFDKFEEYYALVETQYGRRVKCLRSDNGGE
ncbi:putative integrase, catalytic core, Zinc finger, CCHC-type, ribonuclease H-like superfamily [Plasmopara halstedii]